MTTAFLLLGPPSIRGARPHQPAATDDAEAHHHHFLDLLDAGFNNNNDPITKPQQLQAPDATPRLTVTENGSATYADSGNACLDFFFQVVPDTPPDRVRRLLEAAWARDPLTALKLVCNLRGVRGTGKSDREGFYASALWMHANHPRTLACNVPALAEFGYLKDFPELLYRLIHGTDARKTEKDESDNWKEVREARARALLMLTVGMKRRRGGSTGVAPHHQPVIVTNMWNKKPLLSDYIKAALLKSNSNSKGGGDEPTTDLQVIPEVTTVDVEETTTEEEPRDQSMVDVDQAKPHEEAMIEVDDDRKQPAASTGNKKREQASMNNKARKAAKLAVQSLETYYGDRAYRFLFDSVAQFFADLLASDLDQLLAPGGNRRKIGLAAKWCPTPGSSFDRSTLLCEAIARRLFPRDDRTHPEYAAGLSEEHYAYRVLHRLRREVLVPLRKVLELPEVYMSAQRWSELPYTRVASVAMKRYKTLFRTHDEVRFGKYLEDVKAGKAKIAAGALLPHEITAAAYRGMQDGVSELQWRRMVEDLRSKGSLSSCIAVCDVSGSMSGLPMEVCVALGLLISELTEEPWAGKVITFSETPDIHVIEGETLREKLSFVQRMDWGMNTNFQATFDRILRTAVDARLPPEKMIRTLFVFSDMEFDQASKHRPWETDYEAIRRKFGDAGYGDVVPQIVFWNLRDSSSTPVMSTQPGVAMVSGFSKNMVKLFLENSGVVNPEAVMAEAIAGDEYQKLAVFD